MKLPNCITPRPGESVVAYTGTTKIEGEFLGYNVSDDLLIKTQFGTTSIINDYLKVRPKDPISRTPPNWESFKISGQVIMATPTEIDSFNDLLNVRIAPGPSYLDLILEIWARGYEIYLVGGTVRDVINGQKANDVDLVTSMPFNLLTPLVDSMYGNKNYSRSINNGFINIAKNGEFDPSIDLKNFFLFAPGTPLATFGSDLTVDYKLRDFAFNAIYYDPVNYFFIDPSGRGISDAKQKIIHIVKDSTIEHPNYNKANVLIRFFKFLHRGYTYTDESLKQIQEIYMPLFSGMGHTKRIQYFKSQLLKKHPTYSHSHLIEKTKSMMTECGCAEIWDKFYEPYLEELTA